MPSKNTIQEIFGLLILGMLLGLLLYYLFGLAVQTWAQPPDQVDLNTLTEVFSKTYLYVMIATFLALSIWYATAKKKRIVHPEDAGLRALWAILLLSLGVVASIIAYVVFIQRMEWSLVVYGLLVAAALLVYYIPTAMFSPAAFKYSPLGSATLRPRWL